MTPRKIKKRKQREREVREKSASRRVARVKRVAADRALDAEAAATATAGTPFVRPPSAAEIRERIAHNLEILKAIESEMKDEEAKRLALHIRLEAEGHTTPEAKLAAVTPVAPIK